MDLDETLPRQAPATVIGEDLSKASVDELERRIQALETEIARVRQALARKRDSKTVADGFFKP